VGRHLNHQAEKGRYLTTWGLISLSWKAPGAGDFAMWKLSRSTQWIVGRWLIVAAVWVFAAFFSASTTFATTRYVSPTGKPTFVAAGKKHINFCSNPNRPCRTINWAVERADPGDIISVAGGTYVETITVPKNLTIQGAGALNIGAGVQPSTVVDGNKQGVVFTIQSGVTAAIKGMSIVNGKSGQGGGIANNGTLTLTGVILAANEATSGGGGILNKGTLSLNRVWLYRNKAVVGGGLHSDGSATLDEVNVQANEASSHGGINAANSLAVSNSAITNNTGGGIGIDGTVTLLNVTISGNIHPGTAGSGLGVLGGAATLRYVTMTANGPSDKPESAIFKSATSVVQIHNSIVWGNGKNPQCGSSSASEGTLTTPFTDGGFNIFGDDSCLGASLGTGSTSIIADPNLDALSYNGGFFGLTHALKPGSHAIDLVPQDKCTSRDQRGVARPIDGDGDGKLECDAGAFEFKP
jgi:hypothetical protein